MTKYQQTYEKPRADLTNAERIALSILHGNRCESNGIYGRGGFDHFWDCIDDETHNEMWDEMLANIESVLEEM